MAAARYSAVADAVTAASAGTAKSILKVLAASGHTVTAVECGIGFIGASGSAKPVLVELCTCTEAGAGSGSSSVTPAKVIAGDGRTCQATAAKGFTGEPTTQTPVRRWRVHPQASGVIQLPLGREVSSDVAKSLIMRVTFESGETTTNIDGYIDFEE